MNDEFEIISNVSENELRLFSSLAKNDCEQSISEGITNDVCDDLDNQIDTDWELNCSINEYKSNRFQEILYTNVQTKTKYLEFIALLPSLTLKILRNRNEHGLTLREMIHHKQYNLPKYWQILFIRLINSI